MPWRGRPLLRVRPSTVGLQGICVLALLWHGFPLAASAEDTAEIYRSPSEGILLLRVQEGTLSLEVRDAPLDRVLQEISRLADIAITSDGPLQGKVTFRAEKISLDTALKKLLKGRDMTCLYDPVNSSGSRDSYRLKAVRIYLPEGKEAPGRLYSYARPPPSAQGSRKAEGAPPTPAVQASQPEPAPPPPPPPLPPPAGTRSQEEARRFMTEILQGSPDQIDDIVERLKRENPQLEEQIDQFLDSIEEAQQRARETGRPFPALQDLGELGSFLQQTLDDLPGSGEGDDEVDEP